MAIAAVSYVVWMVPAATSAAAALPALLLPLLLYLSFGSQRLWSGLSALAGSDLLLAGGIAVLALLHVFAALAGGVPPSSVLRFAVVVGAAAVLLRAGRAETGSPWWGLAALAVLWLPFELRFLTPLELPGPRGINLAPVLLLDAGLFLFLVYAGLQGVGLDLGLEGKDARAALREFAILAPPLAALGLALGFIRWQPRAPSPELLVLRPLGIYFLNALPEEFLFRGVLLNLLSRRFTPTGALALSSALFGAAHVNNPWANWSYVAMATLAGWFYGRAYLKTGKITASAIVHTCVNWTWATFFHL